MKIESKANHQKIENINPGDVVNINGRLFLVSNNYSTDKLVGCTRMSDGQFVQVEFGTSCIIDEGTYSATTENFG